MTQNYFYLTVEHSGFVKHIAKKMYGIVANSSIFFSDQEEEKNNGIAL